MVEYATAALDDTYTALANPVRRAIFERLCDGEARVTEVAKPFDVSLAAVSKHVQLLERAGLVQRRVEGRDHWLSVNLRPLAEAGEWIERNQRYWEDRLNRLGELLR